MRTTLTKILISVIGLLFFPALAFAASPINGTWYNSYCSRVDLSVSDTSGKIVATYTSHTGSTGTSFGLGFTNPDAVVDVNKADPEGIPFSLGIQWRLINVPISDVDGSWHWVSTFSGQYHPAQTISRPNQSPYQLEETLELLNGLYATASVPGLAEASDIPILWPQTLRFNKKAPSYCMSTDPGKPVVYTPTAEDNISGKWISDDGAVFDLTAVLSAGAVTGTLTGTDGREYEVVGLFDTVAPSSSGTYLTAGQGVTLAAYDTNNEVHLMFAGYVPYGSTNVLNIWQSELKSTTWIDRFTQETLDNVQYKKQ